MMKYLITIAILLVSCVSCAQSVYTCGDSLIDTLFYTPSERPYEQIVSNLSEKYKHDHTLSLEELIQAYPVTAEEFDWFYKTYNPRSEYGDYESDTLTFFVYVDKVVTNLAFSGNRDFLYRIFNRDRFMDVKRNNSLNEDWVLETGYYTLSSIIENGNHRAVHYLFSHLDREILRSFNVLHYYFPDIFQERKVVGSYIAQGEKRKIEAYEDLIDNRIAILLCDIGKGSVKSEVNMQLFWDKIIPFQASLEEALDRYKLDTIQKGHIIFPPESFEMYSYAEDRWYYSKPVLLKNRFEINSAGQLCFILYGEAEFDSLTNQKQNIELRFTAEKELQSLITILDREKIVQDYFQVPNHTSPAKKPKLL